MKTIDYPIYNEKLIVNKLSNGLTVYIQPKPGFNKTTAVLGVNYGAIDRTFQVNGKKITQPAGIAHFLEHKMFDKQDYDVFELFNKTGARSNAYTSFTTTNYLFSTAESLKENLDILLDFVQIPYFTQEKVQREKGIIDQEINMYQNDLDNQAYFKIIANLYPDSALATDIAGTVKTVDQIQLADVQLAYNTFYRPENMSLFITGKVDPQLAMTWIVNNQKNKATPQPQVLQRENNFVENSQEHVEQFKMDVARPKVTIGLRGNDLVPTGRDGLKYEIAISIMFDLFFSENAVEYDKLYRDEIIDDSFSWEFENERSFHFAVLGCDTKKPADFIKQMHSIIRMIPNQIVNKTSEFILQKNELLGNYIEMMDSEEAISGQFDGFIGEPVTIYDEVAILNELTLADVTAIAKSFLSKATMQEVMIRAADND
ncbi:EF-P 5-aminopentanol modification-associated protein YfmH [Lentilactobacillus kisonensis]|uniref:Peptidase M16 inactive domain protein n=1 Tax=Lentilactobacillus kisonensis DSM 19906 = JCM 15041 TaxID=1423766 RepID=A0A0R1NXY0_9LACO|nr:pitrilysin family protein [Lentilactobacillus kisonensis]KRL21811.1 peptidase M16 inactive domain protein [Lentilactobacillus kisonensis DSM 19906 = JCM 15041]